MRPKSKRENAREKKYHFAIWRIQIQKPKQTQWYSKTVTGEHKHNAGIERVLWVKHVLPNNPLQLIPRIDMTEETPNLYRLS